MHKESDDNNSDEDDNVVQENSMQVSAEGDENNTKWVDGAYANNEYVGLENSYPDEFQDKDWVDMIIVENITGEHNKSALPTTTDDWKVGDRFETKVKLKVKLILIHSIWFDFVTYFWTFGPSIEGFSYCCLLLSIDGEHLYEKFRECLLIATEVDADGALYSLAFQ